MTATKKKRSALHYVLTLAPKPGADPIRPMRWILKRLLRHHGLRCVDIRQTYTLNRPARGSVVCKTGAPSIERTAPMDARKYFGITFLSLKDVAEGRLQAVIDKVEEGKFGKLNVIFEDGTALGLNATNTRALAKAYGPNTDHWSGHVVELFEGEASYQGKMQPAVLVKPVSAPVITRNAPESGDAGGDKADSGDMDDDIPF